MKENGVEKAANVKFIITYTDESEKEFIAKLQAGETFTADVTFEKKRKYQIVCEVEKAGFVKREETSIVVQ